HHAVVSCPGPPQVVRGALVHRDRHPRAAHVWSDRRTGGCCPEAAVLAGDGEVLNAGHDIRSAVGPGISLHRPCDRDQAAYEGFAALHDLWAGVPELQIEIDRS